MEHRKYYKKSGLLFAEKARERRSLNLNKAREENRRCIFNAMRNIEDNEPQVPAVPVSKASKRAEMLAKWKAEKQKALEEQKKKQKPVFKVGILQKKSTGSPLIKLTDSYANKNFLKPDQLSKVIHTSINGMMTRAKAKALATVNQEVKKDTKLAMIVGNKKKAINKHDFKVPESVKALGNQLKVTVPQTPKVLKGRKNFKVKINDSVKVMEEKNKSEVTETSVEVKPDVVEVENTKKDTQLDKESVKNDGNKSVTENDFVPIHYSPYVKRERGSERKSPRREKASLSIDVDKLIEKEENEFKCRIFSFRKYVECQTKKLHDLCDLWKDMTNTDKTMPNEVQDEVLSLCGKTKLLTSDKFKQFKDLIDKCENRDPMIKIEDLQGYQDWVAIEVEGLDLAFVKLEERKTKGWKSDVQVRVEKENKPVKAKKATKFQGVRSNIRQHILAARKKMQNDADAIMEEGERKQPEVKTPVKTPRKETSLLKDVLSSEASKLNSSMLRSGGKNSMCGSATKKRNSGIEIMAATRLAKALTPGKKSQPVFAEDTSMTLSEIITPLKSILKLTPSSHSTPKHTVHFRLNRNRSGAHKISEKYFESMMDTSAS